MDLRIERSDRGALECATVRTVLRLSAPRFDERKLVGLVSRDTVQCPRTSKQSSAVSQNHITLTTLNQQ